MSVDTTMQIPAKLGYNETIHERVNQIIEVLQKSFPVLSIEKEVAKEPDGLSRLDNYTIIRIDFVLDYPCVEYDDGKEHRSISLHYDYYECPKLVWMKLGAWGHHIEIAKAIVEAFGGIADFYDCDDIMIDYAMPEPKVVETV
jgi:hypothetical protein